MLFISPHDPSKCLYGTRARRAYLLSQPDLEPEWNFGDFAAAERRRREHAHEVLLRIGSLPQNVFENNLCPESVEKAKPQLLNLAGNRLVRHIVAHVDDQGSTARPQDAVHFAKRAKRIAEVFECRAANNEVDCAAR